MGIRNIKLPSLTNNFSGLSEVEDITDSLPVNPAYTWAQLTGKRDPSALTTIVVHHTGMEKANGCTAANHASSHIQSTVNHPKGDPGIPYHVYCREGRVYQVNDLCDFTYGVSSNNSYTIHIVTEGNFLIDTFTEADRLALYAAILAVKTAVPSVTAIKAHKELQATACPAIDIDRVRADITTIEQTIERSKSAESRRGRAYDVMNQCQYMYALIGKGDGNEEWALSWFGDFYDYLKSKSMV